MTITDLPTETCQKKLTELEAARRRYIQMLYGYLPCLSMPDEAGIAHEAIKLIKQIAEWHEAALFGNGPKKSTEASPPALETKTETFVEPLSESEQSELRGFIAQYQIYVAKDPDTKELTMTHPFIQGIFHPLNEREVLEVARDIAEKSQGVA